MIELIHIHCPMFWKGKLMRFFKDNSYDIIKLYVNQIGIAIFSTVLYTAVGSMGEAKVINAWNMAISIFSILFYFMLVYNVSWEYGAKDKIRIDAGRLQYDRAKGLKMSLFASVPNVVISGICVITAVIYKFSSAEFAAVVSGVLNFFMRITLSMYLGVVQSIFGAFDSVADASFIGAGIAFMLVSVFSLAVTHIGYLFGAKNFKIFSLFSKAGAKGSDK